MSSRFQSAPCSFPAKTWSVHVSTQSPFVTTGQMLLSSLHKKTCSALLGRAGSATVASLRYGYVASVSLTTTLNPPRILESGPVALLWFPPRTVADWPEIKLLSPKTAPPVELKAWDGPTTRLCDPMRDPPVGIGISLYPTIKLPRPVGAPASAVVPDPLSTWRFTPENITCGPLTPFTTPGSIFTYLARSGSTGLVGGAEGGGGAGTTVETVIENFDLVLQFGDLEEGDSSPLSRSR